MKVEVLEDKGSLGNCSGELALHEEAPMFPGVCVSVGDVIEDYEENTLRYVTIKCMQWCINSFKKFYFRLYAGVMVPELWMINCSLLYVGLLIG